MLRQNSSVFLCRTAPSGTNYALNAEEVLAQPDRCIFIPFQVERIVSDWNPDGKSWAFFVFVLFLF